MSNYFPKAKIKIFFFFFFQYFGEQQCQPFINLILGLFTAESSTSLNKELK